MFGVDVDTAAHHYETIWRVIQAASDYIHWPSLIMGVGAFGVMYLLKTISPRVPNVLVAVVLTTLISWMIGFEHNVIVNRETIASTEAQAMIDRFNSATTGIGELSGKRTDVSRTIDQAGESHDTIGVMNAQHEADLIAVHMDRLKEEARHARATLRQYKFRGVPQADETVRFYPEEDLPADTRTDGRVWRIKVGNAALSGSGIVMVGGGAVVGNVPKGLPTPAIPTLDWKVMARLFPFAAIISLLGFMEAISIAKAMAAKTGQRLDPNQELIGQGLANMLGSLGQSYPTSGSFSRSAVNLQSGAKSGMSSVFTSLTVVIALLFFTPLLYHLPQSVLAAVIMMAVIGLVNISGFVHAWHAKWYDGLISIISFAATLVFAPNLEEGIMIGVVLSLLVFLYKSMRPQVVSLARAEDEALRCVSTHGLKECAHVAMVRFDGPLFFANSSYLEDKMMEIMRAKEGLKHIIMVCNGINDIDASGEETLSLLVDRVRSAGVDISLSGVNEAVMQVLRRTHLPEKIGENHIFPTMEKAISAVHPEAHRTSGEAACPLLTVCRLVEN
jgi:anti-anti-sigma factor